MNKIFALLLASILLLSACSSESKTNEEASDTEKGSNELTVWTWDPNFNVKAIDMAKDYYNKENSELSLKIIENAQADIVQKLNTSLSSGTTKGMPNIVLIEDYRAQSFLKAYPDAFFDLSKYYKAEDFAEYKLAPTSLEDKHYGIPFDSGVSGFYVRTDYLEKAGYTVEDLQGIDWNKYIEIGKKVKEATGKSMISMDPKDLGLIRQMIQTSGSWYLKEDGVTPNLADNEYLKEAFQTYKEIVEADISKPVSDWGQYLASFNSGETASILTGNWMTASVKQEVSQKGKWAIVPFPKQSGNANSVNATNLGGSSWYVLDIPGKEKAADLLAKTFGSNVNFYQDLNKEIGAIGTYKPAAEGEAYKAADEFFDGQKITEDFSKWVAEIPQVNYGAHTYVIEDILAVGMQDFLKGKELDKVLNDAQTQAEQQIK
ncbi:MULTISPECIES: ABC transporter substrate-binding protein [unclassified Bacillus (in: firmicutes)]|uniref:ABC transporter substrate-binding protein n=1 Tax=unclassified Bacillus (in: firmicutes) TaxID=185979 RepID=UPI00080AC516|nr:MULTISPECIES: extracellular solute-binding protein [unclassified Bacillus (in: firmicutes)]OCA86605.1 ABC transporter substrate-binding protein [Bacillus sp. FJAT-27986]